MTKTEISLKYLGGIVLPSTSPRTNNETVALSLMAQMMQVGFILTQELLDTIKHLETVTLTDIYDGVIPAIRKFKGADVEYTPMYPNFPEQVMNASDLLLFTNAIGHYWTLGFWKPDYAKLPREFKFEHVKFTEIGIVTEPEFQEVFNKILGSNDSITEYDKSVIKWFIDQNELFTIPENIPFKENMCYLAGIFLEKDVDITPFMKTATDVLRVATYLSDGDISLGSNTKFKSFPRKTRRILVSVLEGVIREEDIERHRNKWKKLFHQLHVGNFSELVRKVADKVRSNTPIRTFNGKVELALEAKDTTSVVTLLKKRPGEFARRLDKVVRSSSSPSEVVDSFIDIAPEVPTRVLLQILGNLKIRHEANPKKIIFPKGSLAKAIKIETSIPALDRDTLSRIKDGIESVLMERFSALEPLGKVWIDPVLKDCPIPTQMRNVSESAFTVARGTRLPIGTHVDQNTLRLFIYWVGVDIDLSATLHDENFKELESIYYQNLKSDKYEVYHSGDITRAPHGAAEFIDITMDKALASGVRYISMDVRVYSGPTFKEHDKCYAGWMTREHPNSNEIFEPKTVQAKIDLISESKATTPVVFDLLERQAIWTDLVSNAKYNMGGNNVRSNRATIEELLEAITTSKNKASLLELFELHAHARGEIVETQEEADVVYSLYEGITPYNIMEINSEYIG